MLFCHTQLTQAPRVVTIDWPIRIVLSDGGRAERDIRVHSVISVNTVMRVAIAPEPPDPLNKIAS